MEKSGPPDLHSEMQKSEFLWSDHHGLTKWRSTLALRKKRNRTYEAEDRETVLKPGADWVKRVNVDIPIWAIKTLDHEATRRGITRQALIKTWLIDRLDLIQEKKNIG